MKRRFAATTCAAIAFFTAPAFSQPSKPFGDAPTGLSLSGDGPCKLYPDSSYFTNLKSFAWVGPCKDGVAEGLGELQATLTNGDLLVWRHLRQRGRYAAHAEERRVWRQNLALTLQFDAGGKTERRALAEDGLPAWARKFVLSKPYPLKVFAAGQCKVEIFAKDRAEWAEVLWKGPCENGRAHGIGVLQIVYKDGARGAFREYREHAAWRWDPKIGKQAIFATTDGFSRSATVDGKQQHLPIQRHDVPVWAQEFLYAAKPAAKTVGVVEGCKFSFPVPAQPAGRKDRWVGDCKDGLAEGTGFWLMDAPEANGRRRSLLQATMRNGSIAERHVTYSRGQSGLVWKNQNEKVSLDDVPDHIKDYLVRGTLPKAHSVASAVVEGCRFSYKLPVEDGRRDRWVGECKNGLAEGTGAWLTERNNGKSRSYFQVTMRDGSIAERHVTYSRGESGLVSMTRPGQSSDQVTIESLPDYIKNYLVQGVIPRSESVAEVRVVAPAGMDVVDAGACKIFYKKDANDRSWRWQGGCNVGGLADGEGLLEVIRTNHRFIQKVAARNGRIPGSGETYSVNDSGGTSIWSWTERKWTPIQREHIPGWAQGFIDAHPVVTAHRSTESSRAYQADLEERRHQEELEERRRQAQEAREEQDRRDRESQARIEMFGSLMRGVAESRRQTQDAQARRQAEIADIQRQNDLYRQQQRAAQDRQWQESQRQQQELIERQRAEEAARQASTLSQRSGGGGCKEVDQQGYPTGRIVSVGSVRRYYNNCIICKADGDFTYTENARCGIDDRPRTRPAPSPSRSAPGSGQR